MPETSPKRIVIVGAGFAGLRAARLLGGRAGVEVTVIDRRNHHLFQPLLYQVALAALSPADVAVPIRSVLARHQNITVLHDEVTGIDLDRRQVRTGGGEIGYDYLIVATGSQHAYFGHEEWEPFAPGLKTLEQATEIRRRILSAFEQAERHPDREHQRRLLNFVIVGGGPTGVELAGALAEMARRTLTRDFRRIDPMLARVVVIEAGPRLLAGMPQRLSERARSDLEQMGVEVRLGEAVTAIGPEGVHTADDLIEAGTVIWAAGVAASALGRGLGKETDRQGRVTVAEDLSLPRHAEVFVAGDLAHFASGDEPPLRATADVAMQQGEHAARAVLASLAGAPRPAFHFKDRGQMATIGRSRALVKLRRREITGLPAWLLWLAVHLYGLVGFRNRVSVMLQWAWSYLTWRRGARLIVGGDWRFYAPAEQDADAPEHRQDAEARARRHAGD